MSDQLLDSLQADVHFGEPGKPLPDWRAEAQEDDEHEVPTEDERKAVASILGFDPWEEDEDDES